MKPTKIKSIELKNFRPFIEQKIDFEINNGKNITIIQGKNGFGKSTLYDAITWCFFGVEDHIDRLDVPICNSKILDSLSKSESIETSVKLVLETGNGPILIERKMLTEKTGAKSYLCDDSELTLLEKVGKNWEKAPYPEIIIKKILPRNMRHFFFLDGEKLRQLFENINPTDIRESIFDLSQMTLIRSAIEHLNAYKNVLRRDNKGKEPRLDEAARKVDDLKNKLDALKEKYDFKVAILKKAQNQKRELDAKLDKANHSQLKQYETERKLLEESIIDFEDQLDQGKKVFLEYLFKIAPFILARQAIEQTLNIISSLEDSDELPPKIQATFLEELLQKGKCICGSDICLDKQKRETLEFLLKKSRYSVLAEDTRSIKYTLKPGIKDINSIYRSKILEYENNLQSLEDKLDDKQKRLKEIIILIGNINSEKIAAMHAEREKYKGLIAETEHDMALLKEEIEVTNDNLKEKENEYKQLLSQLKKFNGIKRQIELCDTGIEHYHDIQEKILNEIRQEIDKLTFEYFRHLISAKEFKHFTINDEFDVVLERDNCNFVRMLSAAETLCLGYSFMAALRKASAFLAPVIIDTPLAKIDEEYRLNVANWLKAALPDAQVILFVLDTEYTKSFRDGIRSNVNQEYKIIHNKERSLSEVVNYE